MSLITSSDTIESAITKLSAGHKDTKELLHRLLDEQEHEGLTAILGLDNMDFTGETIWLAYEDYCESNFDIFFEMAFSQDEGLFEYFNNPMSLSMN